MKYASKKICALVACLFSFTQALHGAITLSINYDFDAQNFFGGGDGATKKAALEAAALDLQTILTDELTAMVPPDGTDVTEWSITGLHPGIDVDTVGTFETDPTIPANTLRIYAGGRSLDPGVLGVGGPGGFTIGGGFASAVRDAFEENIRSRGETGMTNGTGEYLATRTDVAPWGGTISFDNDGSTSWHYDHTTDPSGSKIDFYSVALHELMHVLGMGSANSWTTKVVGGEFTGANSKISNGGVNVTTYAVDGGAHWDQNTMSVTLAGAIAQEAVMDPDIGVDTRKILTNLDAMGLNDIGWDVSVTPVPEPSFYVTLAGLGLVGFGVARRRLS